MNILTTDELIKLMIEQLGPGCQMDTCSSLNLKALITTTADNIFVCVCVRGGGGGGGVDFSEN